MFNPVILPRVCKDWRDEGKAALGHFPLLTSRCLAQEGDLVIARFADPDSYRALEYDLSIRCAKLINSASEHEYIADLGCWYPDLQSLTSRTWCDLTTLPEGMEFVLKGQTNSKKYQWDTHMHAGSKAEAIQVFGRLMEDSLIQYQKVYVREYVPLETYLVGLRGLPITNEYRFFCYKQEILCGGYYWSSHVDELREMGIHPDPSCVPRDFLREVTCRVSENATYYVVDVGKTVRGEWLVIELNDGQMSGLSECDPTILYGSLKNALRSE